MKGRTLLHRSMLRRFLAPNSCPVSGAHLQIQEGFSQSLQLRILLKGIDATTPTTSPWSKMQRKMEKSGKPSGKPGAWGWLWNVLSSPIRLSPLLMTGFHRKSTGPDGTVSAALTCMLIRHSSNMRPPQARGPALVLQPRAGVPRVPNYGIGPGLQTVVLDHLFCVCFFVCKINVLIESRFLGLL